MRWVVLVLVAGCANASGTASDAATDTKRIDAAIDGNSCATQPCSILPQCGCNTGNTCDLDTSDNKGTACRAINMMGTETASCNSIYECDSGYSCIGGNAYASCHKYCSSDADCGSPRGQCVIDISAGGSAIPGIPSVCSSNCDPANTNPPECPSSYKCGLFTTTHMGTAIKIADCSPAGTGVQATTCASGSLGNDALCGKGYLCSTTSQDTAYKCRRICKPGTANNGGCGALTCLSFTPAFTIGGTEYGICN